MSQSRGLSITWLVLKTCLQRFVMWHHCSWVALAQMDAHRTTWSILCIVCIHGDILTLCQWWCSSTRNHYFLQQCVCLVLFVQCSSPKTLRKVIVQQVTLTRLLFCSNLETKYVIISQTVKMSGDSGRSAFQLCMRFDAGGSRQHVRTKIVEDFPFLAQRMPTRSSSAERWSCPACMKRFLYGVAPHQILPFQRAVVSGTLGSIYFTLHRFKVFWCCVAQKQGKMTF